MLRQQIAYDQNLAYLGEWRGASTAGGGTALTTTAALVRIPQRTRFLMLYARNFATAVVAQVALCPYLAVLKTADALASVSDSSDDLQDGAAGTVLTLNSFDTFANGDFLLVGAHQPFRGVDVTIVNANGNASVLSVNYWNGSAWTNITPTDGTTSGGATLAINGRVTWTTPTAWVAARLRGEIYQATGVPTGCPYDMEPLYWTRWSVSAALDSSVSVSQMLAMYRDTTYAEIPTDLILQQLVSTGVGGHGAVEAKTNAGTANLVVNAFGYGPDSALMV